MELKNKPQKPIQKAKYIRIHLFPFEEDNEVFYDLPSPSLKDVVDFFESKNIPLDQVKPWGGYDGEAEFFYQTFEPPEEVFQEQMKQYKKELKEYNKWYKENKEEVKAIKLKMRRQKAEELNRKRIEAKKKKLGKQQAKIRKELEKIGE